MTIKRRIFYSFHYKNDSWRAEQVRKIGLFEGNQPVTHNDWETVRKSGDAAIKRWIDNQLENRTCTVVLVGSETANREWINYEISKSWKNGMGVVGIRIHGLKDNDGSDSNWGRNPFDYVKLPNGERMSSIVECYSPSGATSQQAYAWIERNLSVAIEKAIRIRKNA